VSSSAFPSPTAPWLEWARSKGRLPSTSTRYYFLPMAILCYHAVDPEWISKLSISPDTFRAHCEWLASNRLVVSLEQAGPEITSSGRLRRNLTALTFDDGFASLFDHALPTLVDLCLPATVFLVAATLTEKGHRVDWVRDSDGAGLRTLSRSQILEMQEAGVTFGSHSYAHKDLTTLSENECEEDLRAGRELLEDVLGRSVSVLAYPFGRQEETVQRAAKRAGYTYGFAMSRRAGRVSRLNIPRIGVYAGNGIPTVWAKSSWYLSLKRSRLLKALSPLSLRRWRVEPTERKEDRLTGTPNP
jgi:peptidoglycan/xylan/chitin deacetylase (PgdA/CDA1 family)